MPTKGVDAAKIDGVIIEPLGEFVRLVFELTEGGEFIVRLPAREIQVAIPNLLTIPGRAAAIADPIGAPAPPAGHRAIARATPAAAFAIRTDTDDGEALIQVHVGSPPFPLSFSAPRDPVRRVLELALRKLNSSSS